MQYAQERFEKAGERFIDLTLRLVHLFHGTLGNVQQNLQIRVILQRFIE
jgi:hypothetical protein